MQNPKGPNPARLALFIPIALACCLIFACVGHQSWEASTDMLLETYPEFDETPGMYPGNQGIYCRSWCVQNEAVYPIVFDLFDELADVLGSKGVSVGMDEIFLIGEDACPRCRGKDKAELVAYAVQRLYGYLAKGRGLTMYMWGDRLIDGNNPDTYYDGSEWETSMNGTWPAVDMIPRDIVILDWHYAVHESYGSLPYFLAKGFRVLPATYNDVDAAQAFLEYSMGFNNEPGMLGYLFTTWGDVPNDRLAQWPPLAVLRTIADK